MMTKYVVQLELTTSELFNLGVAHPMKAVLRHEMVSDPTLIAEVVRAAFLDHPHSDGSEPAIIDRLRNRGELTISLVALIEDQIVGHVAFSPVTLTPNVGGWYGLGPLAVHPFHQGQGIGTALVTRGLEELKAIAAAGCVVFGNPTYYRRFGFRSYERLTYPGGPESLFHGLAFVGDVPEATVAYSSAFGDT